MIVVPTERPGPWPHDRKRAPVVSERQPVPPPIDIRSYLHDDYTGLPRRAIFEDRLRHARVRAERRSEVYAVVLIEFAAPPEVAGLLQTDPAARAMLAERVTDPLRISDTVAVFDAAQLAVILEDTSSVLGAQAAVSRMMQAGQAPIAVQGQNFQPVLKVGLAVSSPPHVPAGKLLEHADIALSRAYGREGSDYVTYREGL